MPVNTPIAHVVVIVKEDHAFDSYFGTFPAAKDVQLPQALDPIEDPKHNQAAWLHRHSPHGSVRLQTRGKAWNLPVVNVSSSAAR